MKNRYSWRIFFSLAISKLNTNEETFAKLCLFLIYHPKSSFFRLSTRTLFPDVCKSENKVVDEICVVFGFTKTTRDAS